MEDFKKFSLENPVLRYGVAFAGAALLMGFVLTPILWAVGGFGIIFVFFSVWFVRAFLGRGSEEYDRTVDRREYRRNTARGRRSRRERHQD